MSPSPLYSPTRAHGDVVYLSGQVPRREDGEMVATGRLGDAVSLEVGRECARQCARNLLAVFAREHGLTGTIADVLKLTVFVASAPSFDRQPEVADAASQLLLDELGEAGHHARSAVGVACLPRGVPVEIDAIVALRRR